MYAIFRMRIVCILPSKIQYVRSHYVYMYGCIKGLQNTPKCVFGRGYAPDHAGGAHDASPDSLVGWGGDTTLIPPLDAFAASILLLSALAIRRT